MSILAVGLSHRTAELSTLERVVISSSEVDKVLWELLQQNHVDEAMVVSTCNRVEIYAVVDAFHGGLADVSGVLARQAGLEPSFLYDSLFVHYAEAAVEHVFSVASGLDSMVAGETQILGQIRSAYAAAREAGTVGRALHELMQSALRVGKRVHTETGLGKLGASVVSEALAEAGELTGKQAVILGAGSMGALAASQLRSAGVASITVVNRTMDSAVRIAQATSALGTPARAAALSELPSVIADADVVVTCTGARDVVLTTRHIAPRGDSALVICDLGLPHDVEKEVAALERVRLVDLESIRIRMSRVHAGVGIDTGTGIGTGAGFNTGFNTVAGQSGVDSAREIARATGIVLDELREYLANQRSAQVTPTVAALRKRAAEVVDAELLRLDHRLPELDGASRAELDKTVRRVVDKLLHAPTVRVKQLTARSAGTTDYALALRELFELDPETPVAVASTSTTIPNGISNGISSGISTKKVLNGQSYANGEQDV
jgi:glutamyl-tRNA reductase